MQTNSRFTQRLGCPAASYRELSCGGEPDQAHPFIEWREEFQYGEPAVQVNGTDVRAPRCIQISMIWMRSALILAITSSSRAMLLGLKKSNNTTIPAAEYS